jgi:hypothetical protein
METRRRLPAIVDPEHGFDHPLQLRQLYRSCPPALPSSIVLELLQVDTKGSVEPEHRPGENHGSALPHPAGPPPDRDRWRIF